MRDSKNANLIVVTALAIAGLYLFFASVGSDSVSNKQSSLISPKWADETGRGLSVPACGSSMVCGVNDTNDADDPGPLVACASCANGAPSIDFSWIDNGNTGGYTCYRARLDAKIGSNPEFLVRRDLPCGTALAPGNFTWDNSILSLSPISNTTYNYSIKYESVVHSTWAPPFNGATAMVALDANHLVLIFYSGASLNTLVSNDAGATWTQGRTIDGTVGSTGDYLVSADLVGNNIFVSYYSRDGTNDLRFAKSTDGGVTWTAPITLDGDGIAPHSSNDRGSNNSIDAIDANNIYISYYDKTATDLYFIKSNGGGLAGTWSAPKLVDVSGSTILGIQSSIKAFNYGVNTSVFIGYYDATAANLNAKFARSINGGDTWLVGDIVNVETSGNVGASPSVDTLDGITVYFAYEKVGLFPSRLAKTTNCNTSCSWGAPVNISNLSGSVSIREINASTVYAAIRHSDDPVEIYFATTSNSGTSWASPVLVPAGLDTKLLAVDPLNLYTFGIGDPGGVNGAHSINGGASWTNFNLGTTISGFPSSSFYDNFDQAGNATTNGWTLDAGSSADPHRWLGADSTGMIAGTGGTKGYLLRGSSASNPDDGVRLTISGGNFNPFTIQYDRTTKLSSGTGQTFVAEYSLNGGTSWTPLEAPLAGTNGYSTKIVSNLQNPNNAPVTIHFYVNGGSTVDFRAAVDNVYITGSGTPGHVIKSGTFSTPAFCPAVDYIVDGLDTSPPGLIAGQQVTFAATVQNSGALAASAVSQTRLRLDIGNDGTYDVTTPPFADQTTGALAAGASEVENWTNAWTAIVGDHKFEVCADTTHAIIESNGENNCTTRTFNVGAGTNVVSLAANPTSGSTPLTSALTASVSGTALGTINYSFWFNCSNVTTSIAAAETSCGTLPAPVLGSCVSNSVGAKCNGMSALTQVVNNTYSSVGTYKPKIIVERGSAPNAQSQADVTVNPANVAPSVNAGPDQTITLPASANLDGTVSDDGLPNPPATVSTTWSNPGTVFFGNTASIDTTASFSAAGTYVLRLTANDSLLQSSDTVQVTVNPALPAADFSLSSGSIFVTIIPPAGQTTDSSKTTVTVNPLPFGPPAYTSNVTLTYCPPSKGGLCAQSNVPAGTEFRWGPGAGVVGTTTLTSANYSTLFGVKIPSNTLPSQNYRIIIKGEGTDGTIHYTNPALELNVDNRDPGVIEVMRPIFEKIASKLRSLFPEANAFDKPPHQ